MNKQPIRLAVLAVASVFAVGCGGDSGGGTSGGGASGEPIKIGVISSQSGVTGPVGQDMVQGARLAAERINADGGIDGRPIELVVRDTKADPKVAVQEVRSLSRDGINLFTGVVSSTVGLALPQVLKQVDGVVITDAAGSAALTGENFSENLFRVSDNTAMRMTAAADAMREQFPDVHRWANLSPDYEYGQAAWKAFDERMKRIDPNYEVVANEFPQFGASSFRNEIASVVNAKPQGLFTALYSTDAITMSKQAEAYGLFDRLGVVFNSSNEGDVSAGLGKQMHEEWAGQHYNPLAFEDNELSKQFAQSFKQKYDEDPNGYNSESYTALYAYKAAIEKAGDTSTDKVMAALEGLSFDSVTGKRTFRPEDHQAVKDIVLAKFEPADTTQGWKVAKTATVPGDKVIGPPQVGE